MRSFGKEHKIAFVVVINHDRTAKRLCGKVLLSDVTLVLLKESIESCFVIIR